MRKIDYLKNLQAMTPTGTIYAEAKLLEMPEQTVRFTLRKNTGASDGAPRPRRISQSAEKALAAPDELSPPQTVGAFRVSLPALDAFPAGV